MLLKRLGCLKSIPSPFSLYRVQSFGLSQAIESSRTRLLKLQNNASEIPAPSMTQTQNLSQGNPSSPNEYIQNDSVEGMLKEADEMDILVQKEQDPNPVQNYIDTDKAIHNDMRMINYQSRIYLHSVLS